MKSGCLNRDSLFKKHLTSRSRTVELSELTAYAKEKYNIDEQHKWDDFPGFSVLADPLTGKWAALLMRVWDTETGEMIERCDIKCGQDQAGKIDRPYVTTAFRMHGPKWAGVTFGKETEADVVLKLFDSAMDNNKGYGFTIVLDSPAPKRDITVNAGGDVPIPPRGTTIARSNRDIVPERIRKLRLLFKPDTYPAKQLAEDFFRQATFMRDYEDDYPWEGPFSHFYPTYHHLTTAQLRGYFSWRTRVRKGNYSFISVSAAYIYLYELLNGIGAESVEERLQKMEEFEKGFLDAGFGDDYMRYDLRQWMADLSIMNGLPQEIIRKYAEKSLFEFEMLLSVLKTPDEHTDEEICSALKEFDQDKRLSAGILSAFGSRTEFLISEAWRQAVKNYRKGGADLFTLCFGKPYERAWFPLSNAIYCRHDPQPDRTVIAGSACVFKCRAMQWRVISYIRPNFDRGLMKRFLHAADLKLRQYLKAGTRLRESPGEDWAYPYIDEAIAKDMRREAERRRESVTVDLSGLDKIRADAEKTRDSLLTEEESAEIAAMNAAETVTEKSRDQNVPTDIDHTNVPLTQTPPPGRETQAPALLDPVLISVVRTLMRSEDPRSILKANSILPEIAADSINEALFDEFGDNVVLCEDGHLSLVNEYAEDLQLMLDNDYTEIS